MKTSKYFRQGARESEHHDFGATDTKGRRIGAQIERYDVTTVPVEENPHGLDVPLPPGLWYAWRPHATRDGMKYGATQHENFCATPEQREREIAKYLAAARKRAGRAT